MFINPVYTNLFLVEAIIVDTTNYFKSWWYFCIPAALILYSIAIAVFTEIEWVYKVKRIYYSISIFVYVIMLKNVNLIGIAGEKGLLGTSNKVWAIIVFTIIFFLVSIIIDNWIISGYAFKEFGFFGAKFIRDEANTTVLEQGDYIYSLENGITGSFQVVDDIKTIFKSEEVIEEIKSDKFDLAARFTGILSAYYKHRKLDADIDIQVYGANDIDQIRKDLKDANQLSFKDEIHVKGVLKNKETIYIEKKDYNLLLMSTESSILGNGDNLFIRIKSSKEINLYDRYIVINMLFYFELYLMLTSKTS